MRAINNGKNGKTEKRELTEILIINTKRLTEERVMEKRNDEKKLELNYRPKKPECERLFPLRSPRIRELMR